MERERLFNLQLTVQKLQEELSLYRNGTNGQQLLELISEKENEIETYKNQLIIKTEDFRKLAKISKDVNESYDKLKIKCQEMSEQNLALEELLTMRNNDLQTLRDQLRESQTTANQLMDSNVRFEGIINETKDKLSKAETELSELNENIDKLQRRCAALVSEKTEKCKLLEREKAERMRQGKELRDELSRASRINNELNQKISHEQTMNVELADKLRDSQNVCIEMRKSLTDAQTVFDQQRAHLQDVEYRLANTQKLYEQERIHVQEAEYKYGQEILSLESELNVLKAQNASLSSRKLFLEDNLRVKEADYVISSNSKDDKIQELSTTISDLQAELRSVQRHHEEDLRQREDQRRKETETLKRNLEANQATIQRLENEKENAMVTKREQIANAARIAELEQKVKNQDLYFKRRILDERTTDYKNTSNIIRSSSPSSYRPSGDLNTSVTSSTVRSFSPSVASGRSRPLSSSGLPSGRSNSTTRPSLP